MVPKITLEELMHLCFNAGRESQRDPDSEHWRPWWEEYGQERHDAFLNPPLTDELQEIAPGVLAKRERDFKETPEEKPGDG